MVEVYERVGKSVISVCKKSQKGLTREIYGCDKVEKWSGFVIYLYVKDSVFTAVKRGANDWKRGTISQ